MSSKKPVFNYEIYIAAPAPKVWKGLVDGDLTKQYVYGTRFQSKLESGAPYAYFGDGNFKMVEGEILEVDPNKKLSMTWSAHWDEASTRDTPSRVTYELAESAPGTTRLRVVHDHFDGETATYKGSADGWPLMLSSLKSLLESGKPLPSGR